MLIAVVFHGCSQKPVDTSEEIEAPYITVTKLLSAELYGDAESARQFMDPLLVFREADGNPRIADSLLQAQVTLVRRFARDNRLPSLLAVHKTRVVQKIEGDTAQVAFLDQNGPRERVRFILRKEKTGQWIIIGMEFNILGSPGG
jgi:hypothetical protein